MIETFYFGKENRLFGILNSSLGNGNCGVIICNPIGQEHIRSYRTLSILADRFEKKEFDVFRFDYYGCGDSLGEFNDLGLGDLVKSVLEAIDEFVNNNAFSKVVFVGLRLGANLLVNALKTSNIKSDYQVVLWNPIISGKQYIEDAQKTYKKWIQGSFVRKREIVKGELFGFLYSDKFLQDISKIDLYSNEFNNCKNTLIIESSKNFDPKKCNNNNFLYSYKLMQEYEFWNKEEGGEGKTLVPLNTLNEIIEFSSLK